MAATGQILSAHKQRVPGECATEEEAKAAAEARAG
jgi:hypothetical protein